MTKDLAVNKFFSVYKDADTMDIATVTGRDAFEQAVIITLHKFEQGVFGETNPDTLEQKLRQILTRVARQRDEIQSIEQIQIEKSETRPGTYQVTVLYNVGDAFTEDVTL